MPTALAIAPDGTLCVDKTKPAAELAAEAELLAGLDLAGVPVIVEGPRGGRLRLRHAGRHTLATWTPPSARELAVLLAALADTVDALHECGIVHGAIRADHVVVAGNGAPVLVGFSSARHAGVPGRLTGAVPLAERRVDVTALGELCRTPVGARSGVTLFGRRRNDDAAVLERAADGTAAGRFETAGALASSLRSALGLRPGTAPTVIDGSARPRRPVPGEDDAPALRTARPTAEPRRDGPHTREPQRNSPGPHTREPQRNSSGEPRRNGRSTPRTGDGGTRGVRSRALGIAAGVIGALGVVGAGLVASVVVATISGPAVPGGTPTVHEAAPTAGPDPSPAPSASDHHPTAAGDPQSTADATTAGDTDTTDTSEPGASQPAAPDGSCGTEPGPDVDGDGCADAVRTVPGAVIVDGARFSVGESTDQLVVGDWDCDGTATLVVVRPGSGEVWSFATWPTGGEVTGELVATVPPPATATVAVRDGEDCDRLVVRGSGRTWTTG